MAELKYIKGDLFNYLPNVPFVIPHIVNSIGKWGSGFVIPLGQKFPKAREEYLDFYRSGETIITYDAQDHIVMQDIIFELGMTQIIEVNKGQFVANMIAQEGVVGPNNPTPIKYDALEKCMSEISYFCQNINLALLPEIIAPKFGSERARGDWNIIEKMINEIWIDKNIKVTIFYL